MPASSFANFSTDILMKYIKGNALGTSLEIYSYLKEKSVCEQNFFFFSFYSA